MSLRTLHRRFLLAVVLLCWGAASVQLTSGQLWTSVLDPSPASFQLGWNDLGPTNAYTVQYRDSLGDAVWLNAPHTAPWPVAVPQWTDPRPNGAIQRFYRVLAVEPAQRGLVLTSALLASYPQ